MWAKVVELKFEIDGIKIEIKGDGGEKQEKIMVAVLETMKSLNKKTTKKRNNKNYVPSKNGVREVNGTKLYKCHYNCACGKRGHRHLKEDAEVTECHECKQELKVFPSTANDAHDEKFNYFIAY